ncbi:uncharacterized membrane-anchored protein YitT (DUF2179 family) [Clostridium punense]|uniref:Uncharacterized membrane-anchored protein YitT (DUF2179 family) n=1 Tax=Clostridium punense TaxID=1054297 RepID=A0ABS4K7J8_9CLOT|nr:MULTISPECIES: YitT family protein [Clostridium]EQB88563.1 hypothetical protein M918_03975 [Clostridium sp. BL8]MBP2023772.1 uncharacterized membrane-anchored protein YitT (DUF2179 family) [Clostridium punense]
MKSLEVKNKAFDFIFVTIGCILVAFSITSILKPNELVAGGITGISIITEQITKISYEYIYYFLSLLVLIAAYFTLGKREAVKIVTLSVTFPMVLIIFERMNFAFIENDRILASIYFGIICGVGTALILKRGFSQGGSDTIAKILHNKLFPFISLSEILLCIDGVIIISSAIIYDKEIALYAIISQLIFMKVVDTVLYGFSSKRVKVEIISENHEVISNYILTDMKRGISTYEIKGGYMNMVRLKIVTICSPRESMLIKMFISNQDPNAFVNVLPVTSVWGKGLGFESL